MKPEDYNTLDKLEEAFERRNIPYFVSFLEQCRELPLLLRVHAVCMLEDVGDESVVMPLCRVLKEDPSSSAS